MPCEHMGVLLSRYVDGEASAEDRRVVEGHVRECEGCRNELGVFQRNEGLLAQAFSEEVAGEAFIADVLAKAGLAPSRPGPFRRRMARVAGAVAAFLSVPARAVAAVLLALSGFLAWNSYEVHRQNRELIDDIQVALARIQRSNEDNAALVELLDNIKTTIRHAMAQPDKAPQPDVARDPETAPPPAEVVDATPPAEQPEPEQELKALLPTDFFHSIRAVSWEEGVWLSWETKPPVGKVTYEVYRQDAPGTEFRGPLNSGPVLTLCYLDESARPASTYAYQVWAVPEKGEVEKSRAIEIHTLGNIVIQNNGVMSLGNESRSIIEVRRYVDGRWLTAIFPVAKGEPIGSKLYSKETKTEVDFSTGCMLQQIDEGEREVKRLRREFQLDEAGKPIRNPRTGSFYILWREVSETVTTNRIGVVDKSGKEYKLWKGEGRRGTLGSLE